MRKQIDEGFFREAQGYASIKVHGFVWDLDEYRAPEVIACRILLIYFLFDLPFEFHGRKGVVEEDSIRPRLFVDRKTQDEALRMAESLKTKLKEFLSRKQFIDLKQLVRLIFGISFRERLDTPYSVATHNKEIVQSYAKRLFSGNERERKLSPKDKQKLRRAIVYSIRSPDHWSQPSHQFMKIGEHVFNKKELHSLFHETRNFIELFKKQEPRSHSEHIM